MAAGTSGKHHITLLFMPAIFRMQRETGTCQDCDRYVDKAEAEKTPEQRYDEEQAAIDRETAKKLTEMEQEEKMQNLPSDERKRE